MYMGLTEARYYLVRIFKCPWRKRKLFPDYRD
jgi:hypothetical protein